MSETLFNLLDQGRRQPIEIFANLDFKTDSGVYFIDDVYIGKADNFIDRSWQHVLCPREWDQGHNHALTSYIEDKFKNDQKINIRQISKYVFAEPHFIYEYSKYYELLNFTHIASKDVITAAKDRRTRLMNQASTKTKALLTEMYGDQASKEKFDTQHKLLEQKNKKVLFLMNHPLVKDRLIENEIEEFLKLKQVIADLEMEGHPIPLPKDFFEFERPVVKQLDLTISGDKHTKSSLDTDVQDNGLWFGR